MRAFEVIAVESLADAVNGVRAGDHVIVDLDGTLVITGDALHAWDANTSAAIAELLRSTSSATIVTNRSDVAGELLGLRVVSTARKPFTRRSRLPESIDVVVGDQFLTDGLLAARMDARFLHVRSLDRKRRPLAAMGDRALRFVLQRLVGLR